MTPDLPAPASDVPAAHAPAAHAPYAGVFDAPPAFQWSVPLPVGPRDTLTHSEWSSPQLVGDRIYVGAADGPGLFAFSRRNGTLVQVYETDAAVETEATLAGERLYVSDSAGNTYAFTLAGERLWKHDGTAPILVPPTLLADGRTLVTTAVDDLAIALDAATGELQWQYRAKRDPTRKAELTLFAAPQAWQAPSGELVLGFSSGAVVSVDAATGEELWKRGVGEGRYPDVVADPVFDATDLYSSGYYGPFVAIDLPTHNIRWRIEAGAAHAPLLRGGDAPVLYHPGTDGDLRAISAITGAERWIWVSGGTGALTTPRWTEAGLLVASSEGGLWLVDPETGKTAWAWQENHLLSGISSPPAVDGRQLVFVSNAGRLYAMVVPERSPEPLPRWP